MVLVQSFCRGDHNFVVASIKDRFRGRASRLQTVMAHARTECRRKEGRFGTAMLLGVFRVMV